jgi:hypothetical protein
MGIHEADHEARLTPDEVRSLLPEVKTQPLDESGPRELHLLGDLAVRDKVLDRVKKKLTDGSRNKSNESI